jgi:hypothetical protein
LVWLDLLHAVWNRVNHVLSQDDSVCGDSPSSIEHVPKFADVAGPVMPVEDVDGPIRDTRCTPSAGYRQIP